MNRGLDGEQSPNCARNLADALSLLDQQQIGENIAETAARNLQVEELGQSCIKNSQNPQFCEAHCVPSLCPAHTGETIVQLNSRILTTEGTRAKSRVVEELQEAANIIEEGEPTSYSSCPFLKDPDLFAPIAEELKRGLGPKDLADLGLGAEPSPLGGTLASDMDPEVVLAPKRS